MKMIILAVVGVLVLAGGGAGAYFFFFAQPAEASIGETEEHLAAEDTHEKEGAESHAAADDHGEGAPLDDGIYSDLGALVIPVIDGRSVTQSLSIAVVLDLHDYKTQDKANATKPRLRSAFLKDIYAVLTQHAATQGGDLEMDVIKERLKVISEDMLGEGKVNDVVIKAFQQRAL